MPEQQVSETIIVTFDNAEHQAYWRLLNEHGFDMTITAGLRVGLMFKHPKKLHVVRLDTDEDQDRGRIYEPHLFVHCRVERAGLNITSHGGVHMGDYDTPMYPEHYSETEWKWLTWDNPSSFDLLRRELHIWLKVRPNSMNSIPQLGA